MQSKTLTVLLAAVSLATAQSLADLPSCATNGAVAAIGSTGCSTTDVTCICTSKSFTSSLLSYAHSHCSAQDYQTAIAVGQSICASAGVTVTSASSAAASTSMATADAAASSMPASSMTSAGNDTVTTTECGCEETMSATKSAVVATFTGAAARVGGAGALAGVVGLGLFAWI